MRTISDTVEGADGPSRTTSGRMPRPIAGRGAAWLAVLVGGEAFYQVIRRVALATDNPRLLPGMVLMGALIVPVGFLTFLWGRRTRHQVSLGVALLVALAGGCIALALAAAIEQVALDHAALSALVVGSTEEAAKLAVTAAFLLWVIPATPRNGLVAGAACGAGFAVMETLGYVFVDYLQPGGGMAALNSDLLDRSLLVPATHLTWAALTGCAFGYAAARRWRPGPVMALLVTYAGTVVLHTVWDAYPSPVAYLLLTGLGLTLLATALRTRKQS